MVISATSEFGRGPKMNEPAKCANTMRALTIANLLERHTMAERDRTAYLKAWREANAEKIKAYAKARYAANKDARKAYAAAHYRANADAYKQRAAEWAVANNERRQDIASRWRKDHPEVYIKAGREGYQRHREKRVAELKAYRERNPEIMRAAREAWNERHPEANAHHVGLRRTRRLQAMPAWADVKAIRAIYAKAKRISAETGIEHHVDHFYPLKGETVCGLHNEFNLRVVPASMNLSKRNKVVDA